MTTQERLDAISRKADVSSRGSVSGPFKPERIYDYPDPLVTEDIPWLLAYIEKLQRVALLVEKHTSIPLSEEQADEVENEMRRLEADAAITKRELRLFMQSPMPCGHNTGNLLTCPTPPFGCLECRGGEPLRETLHELSEFENAP